MISHRPSSPLLASGALLPPQSQKRRASTSSEEVFETAPQAQAAPNKRHVQSTQEILAAPTQQLEDLNDLLDLTYPDLPLDPDEGDDNDATRNSGEGTSRIDEKSTADQEEQQIRELDEWINSRLESGKAANEQQIFDALSCTSMNPSMADRVLEYLRSGKPIPARLPGVWTEEDDKCLLSSDARGVAELEGKHGKDAIKSRFEYLMLQGQATRTNSE